LGNEDRQSAIEPIADARQAVRLRVRQIPPKAVVFDLSRCAGRYRGAFGFCRSIKHVVCRVFRSCPPLERIPI